MSTDLAAEEFCPNCGRWVTAPAYDIDTGWCRRCARTVPVSLGVVCAACGLAKPPTDFRHGRACRACQTAARTAYRHAHRDQELATDRARIARLGVGACPTCGRGGVRLTTTGVLVKHRPPGIGKTSPERCDWQGAPACQPVQEART